MKTDASQYLMLGVLGLGAYAAYRMTQATPGGTPAPSPSTPGALPPPLAPGADMQGMVLLGNPLHLKKGQYYAGRLSLPDIAPMAGIPSIPGLGDLSPFRQGASEEVLGRALTAMGFGDVRVYMTVADVPSTFPKSSLVNPHAGTRWFRAMWNGPATMDVPRPPAIEMMWVTSSPALEASRAVSVSGETPFMSTATGKLVGGVTLAAGAAILSEAYPAHRVPILLSGMVGLGALYFTLNQKPGV